MSADPIAPAPRRAPLPRSVRRTVLASFMGSTFEWYDFGIYATTAGLVFNQVFFPQQNPAVGTMVALTTTAVGYFTRPIGGIIFGHFGDRVGRKKLLIITMLLMGIPTFLIGLLPSYATIGLMAPILLLLMRLLQGIGLGGEYAGAALATIESVPTGRRGFFGSIPQLGNPIGGLLGSVLILAATSIAGDDVYAQWLWRVPFLLSAVLLIYALRVRLRLVETGDFHKMAAERGVEKSPLATVIRYHWRPLLLGLGARCADAISGNIPFVPYIVDFLHLSNSTSLATTIIPSVLAVPLMLGTGAISDRIGRKRMFLIGLGILALTIFPMFGLLNTEVFWLMVAGIVVMRLGNSTQFAVQSAFLADVFPTEVRYTAVSLVYQVSAIIGGLTGPACIAILIASGGNAWPLALILTVVLAACIGCAAVMRPHPGPSPQAIREPVSAGSLN